MTAQYKARMISMWLNELVGDSTPTVRHNWTDLLRGDEDLESRFERASFLRVFSRQRITAPPVRPVRQCNGQAGGDFE